MRLSLPTFVTVVLVAACQPLFEDEVEQIVSDPEKLAYLRSWIDDSLNDREFLEAAGELGRIRFDLKPQNALGLDREYLGLTRGNTFIQINRLPEDRGGIFDTTTILSVQVGSGRAGLLFDYSDSEELGMFAIDQATLIQHEGGVFTYYWGGE